MSRYPNETVARFDQQFAETTAERNERLRKSRTTIELDIPATAEERAAHRSAAWDRWYGTLPADLRRKLSLHDFKRLGDCFKQAFGINEILPPPSDTAP